MSEKSKFITVLVALTLLGVVTLPIAFGDTASLSTVTKLPSGVYITTISNVRANETACFAYIDYKPANSARSVGWTQISYNSYNIFTVLNSVAGTNKKVQITTDPSGGICSVQYPENRVLPNSLSML